MSTPPSTWYNPDTAVPFTVKLVLIGAVPHNTIPPQSPDCGLAEADVNTIGLSTVPLAIIFAPRQTTKAETSAPENCPFTVAPASTVRVTPLVMYTIPDK